MPVVYHPLYSAPQLPPGHRFPMVRRRRQRGRAQRGSEGGAAPRSVPLAAPHPTASRRTGGVLQNLPDAARGRPNHREPGAGAPAAVWRAARLLTAGAEVRSAPPWDGAALAGLAPPQGGPLRPISPTSTQPAVVGARPSGAALARGAGAGAHARVRLCAVRWGAGRRASPAHRLWPGGQDPGAHRPVQGGGRRSEGAP